MDSSPENAAAPPTAAEADAYLLGTDRVEHDRLREQHHAWCGQALALWTSAGLGVGQRVLDLGCGPGFTSLDLAEQVGPSGEVLAVDRSAAFLEALRREAGRRGWNQLDVLQADIESLDLPAAGFDGIYARWLFCWLEDPDAALTRVATLLRPGGALVIQEYLHWRIFSLLPPHPAHAAVVDACMRSWDVGGATIDVGARLVGAAREAGLVVERCDPVARSGRPGSPVWRWVTGFLDSYLPRLVERGLLDDAARRACVAALDERARDPRARILAPLMGDLVLRRPVDD